MPFINIVLLRALRAGISIISLIVTAKYIGVTLARDAWLLALTVLGITCVFLFNPTLEIFRAKIIQLRSELSHEESDDAISSYISFSALVALAAALTVIAFPNIYCAAVTVNAGSELVSETSKFLQWGALYIAITHLGNSWSSILNSHNFNVQPEIIGIFAAGLNALTLLLLVPTRGADALLFSTLISSCAQLLLLGIMIRRFHPRLYLTTRIQFKFVRKFIAPALPLYFSFGAGQLALIVEKNYLVLSGAGGVSIYDYARKFIDVPYGVIIATAAALAGPALARLSVFRNDDDFNALALNYLKSFIIILLPATAILNLGAPVVIDLFFYKSVSITSSDRIEISNLMAILAWGLIGISIYAVGSQSLIGKGRIRQYAKIGVAAQVIFMAIVWLFFARFNITALAYAWGASHALAGIVMLLNARISLQSQIRALTVPILLHVFFVGVFRGTQMISSSIPKLMPLALMVVGSVAVSLGLIYRAHRAKPLI